MSSVCEHCGNQVVLQPAPHSSALVCPECRQAYRSGSLQIVTGVSGAGKSSILPSLRHLLPAWSVFDTDGIFWGETPQEWELWLKVAWQLAQCGRPVLLCGYIVPWQLQESESYPLFCQVDYLLLRCQAEVLRRRLATRPKWRAFDDALISQHQSFAVQLEQEGSRLFPGLTLVDTSTTPPQAVAEQVADWAATRYLDWQSCLVHPDMAGPSTHTARRKKVKVGDYFLAPVQEKPVVENTGAPIDPVWRRWVADGLLHGDSRTSMRAVMVQSGHSLETARAEVERAEHHPYMRAAQRLLEETSDRGLLGLLGAMARLHPDHGTVPRRSGLSREDFLRDYYACCRPVILQDMLQDWAAPEKWSPDYLMATLGDYPVAIQPLPYTQDPPGKMGFHEYVAQLSSENARYMYSNAQGLRRGEVLRPDISLLGDLVTDEHERPIQMLFGPKGALTPLHRDPCSNLLAQVMGRKEWFVLPPYESQLVHSAGKFYSPIDCEHPDLEKYPEFAGATVIHFVLEPGEVLFLPAGWWHQVRSLDLAISLSFENFAFANPSLIHKRKSLEEARGDYQ